MKRTSLDNLLDQVERGYYKSIPYENVIKYSQSYLDKKLKAHGMYYKQSYTFTGISDTLEEEFDLLDRLHKFEPDYFVKPYSMITKNKTGDRGYIMTYAKGKPLLYYVSLFHMGKLKSEDYKNLYGVMNRLVKVILDLHQNGLYHGDIHDENIIIDIDKAEFKIIDPYPMKEDIKTMRLKDLDGLRDILRSLSKSEKMELYNHSKEYEETMQGMRRLLANVSRLIELYKNESACPDGLPCITI